MRTTWWAVVAAILAASACREVDARVKPGPEGRTSPPASAPATASASPSATAAPAPKAVTSTRPVYGWPNRGGEALEERFRTPPAGFTRRAVPEGSFGAFLRGMPLAPDGEKVVDYQGTPLYAGGHHENIAAVFDIDIGTRDLQQCADAYYRLHAEWKYASGVRKEISYKSLSGVAIPYGRYLAGERAAMSGGALKLLPSGGARKDEHAFFRTYLDDVFAWASTGSLERDAKKVPFAELEAGDAFVLTGSPFGHAVIVLDVAKADDGSGRVALLLGQSYMPAQSMHVLRPSRASAWFVVDPKDDAVTTPFWRPFPLGSLRRLP